MITDKDLIRRALLGDHEAQQECTEKRIALPCPYCGSDKLYVDGPYRSDDIPAEIINDIDRDYDGYSVSCSCGNYIEVQYGTFKDTLAKWNTRPAPPIGRCGGCKFCEGMSKNQALHCSLNSFEIEYGLTFITPESFCSYFEPKEDWRWK